MRRARKIRSSEMRIVDLLLTILLAACAAQSQAHKANHRGDKVDYKLDVDGMTRGMTPSELLESLNSMSTNSADNRCLVRILTFILGRRIRQRIEGWL